MFLDCQKIIGSNARRGTEKMDLIHAHAQSIQSLISNTIQKSEFCYTRNISKAVVVLIYFCSPPQFLRSSLSMLHFIFDHYGWKMLLRTLSVYLFLLRSLSLSFSLSLFLFLPLPLTHTKN